MANERKDAHRPDRGRPHPDAVDAEAAARRGRALPGARRMHQPDLRRDGRARHAGRRDRRLDAQADPAGQADLRAGADRAQHRASARSVRGGAEERQQHGRVRGAQPRRGRRRAGDLRRRRHVEHGRHLVATPASARASAAPSSWAACATCGHSRSIDYPVWASEITPVTGKWRLETVEINGEIQMGDVRVNPGDLVVADDTGVVFIPRDSIMAVLELCEKKKQAEDDPHRRDLERRPGAGVLRQGLGRSPRRAMSNRSGPISRSSARARSAAISAAGWRAPASRSR